MAINIRRDDLIYPYFVTAGRNRKEKIESFPGQFRFSQDRLLKDIEEIDGLGIGKVLLFGVPARKDGALSQALSKNNIVSAAVREVKKFFPGMMVMTDVCLCAYISHGHCGILKGQGLEIDNGKTLVALAKMALSHAAAGADYVAPSAMAKRQVSAIRKALDENGFRETKIMGYSAKFASNFYGPFRDAADSAPAFGDRSGYQLSFGDSRSAIREIEDDIKEGADIVMVKPAIAYLDIIKEAKTRFRKPLAAYNVSGEYAMVKAYAGSRGQGQGSRIEKGIVTEIITAIKRAGADYIITYHAKDLARWLKE